MATASVTNTFVASTAAEAAEVNTNFTDLVTFLNNSAVHRDGSKAMTAAFDGGTYRLTNVGTATAVSDAPRFDQTGISDYEATGSGVTVTTGGTTVDTVSVTTPAAGLALVCCYGSLTTSGGTYAGGEGGQDGMSVLFSVSGTGGAGVKVGAFTTTSFTSNTTKTRADVFVVPLASGANTITVTATRTDSGSPGGTLTADTGYRTAVMGAF